MKRTALVLAFAMTIPAWGQEKPAETEKPPATQEAEKPEPAKKPVARKHTSKRMEDARHCLEKDSNTEIIKCAEAYL